MLLVLAIFATLAATVHGHASMIMPPTRNAIDSTLPGWDDGKHPETGWIEPYNCACTNGSEADCNSGQSCFWFSQGCTVGCKKCDGQGQRYPSWDHCPGTPSPAKNPNYLPKKYWTANHNATPGSMDDIWRFHPWRAPGHAPVWDACGMAGGTTKEVFNAGAYNSTKFAKQGDLGSVVLKARPSGTVWKRGEVAKARWQMTAQHGGGYQFRLCSADQALTEACFQAMPLQFATPTQHKILFPNGSFTIPAVHVDEGPAKGWMRQPFPDYDSHPCDYDTTASGKHCAAGCPGCKAPWYAADTACPTPCHKAFPNLPDRRYSADPAVFPNPLPHHDFHSYAVEDELKVPTDVKPGKYVLGWRWDAEMTSQVWSSCADIVIE